MGMHELSKTSKVFRYWLRQLVPNVGTVLAVALMLFVYNAQAAHTDSSVAVPTAVNATPGVIPYQGVLTDASGNPLKGPMKMVFKIYNVAEGGTAKWTEAYSAQEINVENGVFHVMLGSKTAFQQSDLNGYPLYLEITVGDDAPMMPREMIGSVPTALSVADNSVGSSQIIDKGVNSRHVVISRYEGFAKSNTNDSPARSSG